MKGDKRRKASQMKKGHPQFKKSQDSNSEEPMPPPSDQVERQYTRLSPEESEMVSTSTSGGASLSAANIDGKVSSICLLRPRSGNHPERQETSRQSELEGNRVIDVTKMTEAVNSALEMHHTSSPDCRVPQLVVHRERKWGLAWKITLKCTECHLISPEMKMYKEVETNQPGPNAAAQNVGLAVGLQDTPIGNSRARLLLANMDIPPPCHSAMQRQSNKVSKAVTELNTQDMAEKVKIVKNISEKMGSNPNEMNIAMDGRYNSTTIVSRKKPGQNASQAIGLACETMTEKKYIVAASFQNKLCWTGAWLRGKGIEVRCPDGHPECTANISAFAPLSELNMGTDIGNQLTRQGILIKYATTDGDARSAEGLDKAMKLLDPMWKVQRQADPTHLAQGQFRQCYKAQFSADMFPGATTRDQKMAAKRTLSQDVKARCSLVLKELMKEHAGDMKSLSIILPKVLETTLKCYDGDCSQCGRHSVVCGGGVTNSWWQRSMFLACNGIEQLNMNDSDRHLLLEILKMKLSVQVVESMKLYTNTQKCEASNRSLSVSVPKNVNFPRNMVGRASSAIHRLNNNQGASTIAKCEAMGVDLSPRCLRSLSKMDKDQEYQKRYQKNPSNVKRKLIKHGRDIVKHCETRKNNGEKSDYQKGQLDPKPSHSRDHPYSR